jgi:hypothetical protein
MLRTWAAAVCMISLAACTTAGNTTGLVPQASSRYLVAVSDTDMMSTSYHAGELVPPLGQLDTLSIFARANHKRWARSKRPTP